MTNIQAFLRWKLDQKEVNIDLPTLNKLVDSYFEFRGLKEPDTHQAFLFLTSEIGELADQLVQMDGDWVRNHPDRKIVNVAGEIGDVLMMLIKTAQKLGIDPLDAMVEKFISKGWRP